MNPALSLQRLYQVQRLLAALPDDQPRAERIELIYAYLFANEGFGGERVELEPPRAWPNEALERAKSQAADIVARYTELFYDPSKLPVTHYRKQRRVSARLDELISPILREIVARTGETADPDLFLNEPIFFLKKEARTRAFPKNKQGRIGLDLVRERFRLLLSRRLAA